MSGMEFRDRDKALCTCSSIAFKLFISDHILYAGKSEDSHTFARKFLFTLFFKIIISK